MYALPAVPEASTVQDRQPTPYRCSSSQVFTRASSCAEHSAPGYELLRCWQTSWHVATVDMMTGDPGVPARRGPGTWTGSAGTNTVYCESAATIAMRFPPNWYSTYPCQCSSVKY